MAHPPGSDTLGPYHRAAGEDLKVHVRTMSRGRVAILGTGYVGTANAVGFAEMGCDVVGFDIDGASRRLDLTTLETIALPTRTTRAA